MQCLISALILLSLFVAGSKSCFRIKQNRPSSTTSTTMSGASTTTTSCTPIEQCDRFEDLYNSSVLLFSACAPFLNGSCVSMDTRLINLLSVMHGGRLINISSSIAETCNCKNRSTEIFCRYFLPECSFADNRTCSESSCESPMFEQPCSGYCSDFFNSCISNVVENLLKYVFEDFNITYDNLSVNAICNTLKNESCWNGTNANGLISREACLAPAETTSMTTITSAETTIRSIQTDSTEAEIDIQSTENQTTIVIIASCVVGLLVIVLLIAFVVWRFSKSKPHRKEPLYDDTTQPEKEVVYNSLYKSVELKPNNSYQNVDLATGKHLDSIYTKINESPKQPQDQLNVQENKK